LFFKELGGDVLSWGPLKELEEVMREVELIETRRKRKIEPRVKPLVTGLRRCRIKTIMSCEGHLDKFPFPWIDIVPKDTFKVLLLCGAYNVQRRPFSKEILWGIIPLLWPSGKVSIRLVPVGESDLGKLQKSAVQFGEFLQTISELPMNFGERLNGVSPLFIL